MRNFDDYVDAPLQENEIIKLGDEYFKIIRVLAGALRLTLRCQKLDYFPSTFIDFNHDFIKIGDVYEIEDILFIDEGVFDMRLKMIAAEKWTYFNKSNKN